MFVQVFDLDHYVEEKHAELIARAYEWVGTPRADGQSSREGCDCVGFLIGVAKEIGYLDRDFKVENYSQLARGESLMETLDLYLKKQVGGPVKVFEIRGLRTHVGIVDEINNKIIHSHHLRGVCCETYSLRYKKNRVASYSFREDVFASMLGLRC